MSSTLEPCQCRSDAPSFTLLSVLVRREQVCVFVLEMLLEAVAGIFAESLSLSAETKHKPVESVKMIHPKGWFCELKKEKSGNFCFLT